MEQGGKVLRLNFLRWLGWALVGAADALGYVLATPWGGPVAGALVGAAGSAAGFFIFKNRGWDPW